MCTNPGAAIHLLALDNHILAKCAKFWLSYQRVQPASMPLGACCFFFPHMRSCYYDKSLQYYPLSMCSGFSNLIKVSVACDHTMK
ncbi:hypothetical protein N7505_012151 [Penicillium chrysogenum]|uniref:Uncharacterized protein n=1 Tax=Penicillium chrysogenum TaxID=5076 RepID=A0ABQ8W2N1_PENCH|nr:hypothetical protein N7505_012151 [Penicillium chrysogenum]